MGKAGRKIPKSLLLKLGKLDPVAELMRPFVEAVTQPKEVEEVRVPRLAADKSVPQKRHAPKSAPAIAVLKHLYPPDGCPSRQAVPDSELERAYHKECDRRDIHKNDRVKHTQLLRCAERKKS